MASERTEAGHEEDPRRLPVELRPGAAAPTIAAVALCVTAAAAAFGLVSPAAHWLIDPVELPDPLPEQNQDAESLTFLLVFAVALPLAALVLPRRLDALALRHGQATAAGTAAALVLGYLALLAAVKLADEALSASRPVLLFAVSVSWVVLLALAPAAVERAKWLRPFLVRSQGVLWAGAGLLLAAVSLSFVHLSSISLAPLFAGLVLAAGVAVAGSRSLQLPAAPSWARRAIDAGAVLAIVLAVPNLAVLTPEGPFGGAELLVTQFHQNFYLGPANGVLGGEAVLVDVFSQYGVGSILFLAGIFEVVPIGNGTLALTEAALSAGMFACGYATLRLAGVGPALACSAFAVGLVVLVFNLDYPLGALLQHGAFRFGLPVVIVAAAVAEARFEAARPLLRAVQVIAVGVASLWAFETLLYALGAIAGIAWFRAAAPGWDGLRGLVRLAVQALAACAGAHLVFALGTLAGAGELPDWAKYATTLREFLTGKIGEITYNYTPWSPGLALGALYAASALGIVLVLRREPRLVQGHRRELLALSGVTGYGLALFSYFVNRSSEHILPYISLPALMVLTLWVSIALARTRTVPRERALVAGVAAALAALLVAVAWSDAGLRFRQSAIAHAVPGGRPLRGALDRLWNPRPLAYGAADAEQLLELHMPDEHESVVLTSADLSVEALMRTERVNAIPFGDPWEDSFVPALHEDAVKKAVAGLEPGRRALIDSASRAALEQIRSGEIVLGVPGVIPAGLAPLEVEALGEMDRLFRLETVARSPSGVEVVELEAR